MNKLDIRDKMCNQLLMNGSATLSEIMAAIFGEWPLRGLDIVAAPQQSVKFSDFLEKEDLLEDGIPSLGIKLFKRLSEGVSVYGKHKSVDGEDRIWINRLISYIIPTILGNHTLPEKLGHEVTHAFQYQHSNNSEDNYGIGDQYFNFYNPMSPSLQEIQHLSVSYSAMAVLNQKEDKQERPGLKFLGKILSKVKEAILLQGEPTYFRNGIEVQARIQEFLVKGYPHWPHMPQSKEELWAAMISVGFVPSKDVMDELNQSPSFGTAKEIFSIEAHKGSRVSMAQLNNVVRTFSPEKQKMFWIETLPILYADLIEMMGDKEGRARMGLGENHRAAVMLFGPILDGKVKYDTENITKQTEKLGPYLAAGFVMGQLGRLDETGRGTMVAKVVETIAKVPGVMEAMETFAETPEDQAALTRFCDRLSSNKPDSQKLSQIKPSQYEVCRK